MRKTPIFAYTTEAPSDVCGQNFASMTTGIRRSVKSLVELEATASLSNFHTFSLATSDLAADM